MTFTAIPYLLPHLAQIRDVLSQLVIGGILCVRPEDIAAAAVTAHDLNVVSLGEERAAQLGVDVARLKRRALAAGALLAAAAVSVGGIIGFVGLMTPHLLRLVVGPDHRRLLPAVLLAGPTLLILADLVARTVIAPQELPVGVVTALLGGPFFLVLLKREGDRARGGA